MGPIEDLSIDEIKAQFETNFFGAIRVIHSVMPIMRKQKSGTIVNVSSIEGRMAFPLNAAYVSTKFAIEGLSEGMRHEAREFGINVITIVPGAVKTNIINNAKVATAATHPNSPYTQLMQTFSAKFTPFYENGVQAEEVAKVILKAVTSDNPDPKYVVGNDAVGLMKSKKNMSDREFEDLIKGAKTYARII
jgi:NAD(P)-dependent dehydrogenase (short-subunit alcohol dehydrogenase family)